MASDQQFCLRWNNHQSTLVSVFDNLLESQTLVDCTLAADGQYLKAHKVVLSACSPYLESILCQNLDKHPILILKDVKFSELKAMLDYMYRGEVNISQEQLSTFLKAAESLQIKGLTDSGGGGGSSEPRDRDLLKRQDLRKPLTQPVPHVPQPRPVVPHPGLLEPRRSLPHFPPHIADMQPQSPRHAREGSTSPTARKRRRPNRPSSDDSNFVSTPNSLSENQPDTSDSCDLPVKQSAPSTPSNVPNPSTKAQETDSPRTTPQPQINSDQKQIVVKKEFPETLLTPKTELDYGNDNSMEDVNYEDDEDEEVDLSKPGTSFATNNQGFPPWQMGGDASNDDSNIYSPEVSTAATQNNSQDYHQLKELYENEVDALEDHDYLVSSDSELHPLLYLCTVCTEQFRSQAMFLRHSCVQHEESKSPDHSEGKADVPDTVSISRSNLTVPGTDQEGSVLQNELQVLSDSFISLGTNFLPTEMKETFSPSIETLEEEPNISQYDASCRTDFSQSSNNDTKFKKKQYKRKTYNLMCSKCGIFFKYYYKLRNHPCGMEPRTNPLPRGTFGKPPYKCECGKVLINYASYNRHVHYVCKFRKELLTNVNTNKSERLKFIQLLGDPPYKCGKCGAVFKRKHSFWEHFQSCGTPKQQECPFCGNKFNTYKGMRTHLTLFHGVCSYCKKGFRTKSDLEDHQKNEHIKCCFCIEVFNNKNELDFHFQREHLNFLSSF